MQTHIVKEALVFAYEGRSVAIVADDTDVLILLMYHWDPSMANIFMRSEPKKKSLLKVSPVVTKTLLFTCGEVVTQLTQYSVMGKQVLNLVQYMYLLCK